MNDGVATAHAAAGPVRVLRDLLSGVDAWLVGGSVRDRLLGRHTADLDVAMAGDTAVTARALARRMGGPAFSLSDAFGAWRVIARDRSWQVDLTPLGGATILDDLGKRDFTVNALAEPLGGGELLDPFGGRADLDARRLRMVSSDVFGADPLRTLRLPRLAAELGLELDGATAESARSFAPALARVAAERIFAELKRIIACDDAVRGLELMLTLGVTRAVLPELADLRGVEQSAYHHLDVYDHTMAALAETIALERSGAAMLGEHARAVMALLAEPLADELTRGQALRFGALLHDIAKPQTRSVTGDGRVRFLGHDVLGAEMAREALGRLRASERLRAHVAALTRHHLRLGFLVHDARSRRAVFRYLRACEPVEVDVTLLSIADRLATRGDRADQAIARHLELARALVAEGLRWRAGRPKPIVRGGELARRLRIRPGPKIGSLLDQLEEAAFAGEITTSDGAVALARELVDRDRAAPEDKLSHPMTDPDCVFCKIISGELPGQIVAQDARTVSFMDISPGTRGHALVVPRRHVKDLHEIAGEDLCAVMLAAQRLAARARDRLHADGVNLLNSCGGAAWQTVFHFHVHVIPRYEGDPLRLPWDPAPGSAEEIASAAAELREGR